MRPVGRVRLRCPVWLGGGLILLCRFMFGMCLLFRVCFLLLSSIIAFLGFVWFFVRCVWGGVCFDFVCLYVYLIIFVVLLLCLYVVFF